MDDEFYPHFEILLIKKADKLFLPFSTFLRLNRCKLVFESLQEEMVLAKIFSIIIILLIDKKRVIHLHRSALWNIITHLLASSFFQN
jgi:hypothetical protein